MICVPQGVAQAIDSWYKEAVNDKGSVLYMNVKCLKCFDSGREFQTGVWFSRPYCDCEAGEKLKLQDEYSSLRPRFE